MTHMMNDMFTYIQVTFMAEIEFCSVVYFECINAVHSLIPRPRGLGMRLCTALPSTAGLICAL